MSERLSRILVAVEALLILAPTSLLAHYAAVFLLGAGLGNGPSGVDLVPLVFLVVSALSIVGGWILVVSFVVGGARKLRSEPMWLWIASIVGAAIAVPALFLAADPLGIGAGPPLARVGGFGWLSFGAPSVVPFAHILAEFKLRKTSNYRLELP